MTDGPVRPVQGSLIDGMERPIGPIPLSVQTGTNADLMWSIRDLYLTGSVLDVTYGRGGWWQRFQPDPFTGHDQPTDGIDFRALPEPDSSFDTVCFDPPYIVAAITPPTGRRATEFRARYGLSGRSTRTELNASLHGGLTEAIRVARRFVLVKCMEIADGHLVDTPNLVKGWATDAGATLHDVIVHHYGAGGPGGHNIWQPRRTRRAHSYLLVFTVRG